MVELGQNEHGEFVFSSNFVYPGIEYFERLSLSYYFEQVNLKYKERSQRIFETLPAMRRDLQKIVHRRYDDFMAYQAEEEHDLFYAEFGRLYLRTTQVLDDFGPNDVFGGIPYKDYIKMAEEIVSAAIMHRDCCMALAEKTNHEVFIGDILSYSFLRENYIKGLSEARGIEVYKLRQMLSCFTIDEDNYQHHLSYPGAPAAPYFALGKGGLLRSSFGCLESIMFFLNRELKRRHEKDYFNAVNEREGRFRQELYALFTGKNITKIHGNIKIEIGTSKTDIDAIVFDFETNALGLFQLKWQDSFSTSMRERFSRISNLLPKSIEWIDKVSLWVAGNSQQEILKKLKIKRKPSGSFTPYLFVLSRNHVHFSNQVLDERASWGSWFQILESAGKENTDYSADPIRKLAQDLHLYSPANRKDLDDLPIQGTHFKFAGHTVHFNPKKVETT